MNSYNLGIPELIIIATIYLTTPLQSLIVAGAISGGPVVIPTYLAYVKGAYASEARTVISNISNASKMYYQIKGEWPADVDALEIEGQLDLSVSSKLKWTYELSLPDQITATSTEEMSGGAGHVVIYNANTGKFSGYGSPY